MRVTIKDIAKLANVSVGTASMALNGKSGINEETRKKVVEIANKFNYTPNDSARSLITKKSNCIGLIVTDIRNPFFAMLVDEFNKLTEALGYSLLLGISGDKVSNEKKYVETFISKNVEGIIIVPTIESNPDLSHLYSIKRLDIPLVFCTTAYQGFPESCIMTDLKAGQYEIVKHLLSHGMERIFLITGYQNLLLSQLRFEGYKQAFDEAGKTFQNNWVIETIPDYDHGYESALQIIESKPDAIITINDFLAMGVLKALKDMGISVPQQISIAGYDDLLFSSILETPLSTVRQPVKDICIKTLDVLFSKIKGDNEDAEMHYLDPVLKIRNSTR
jgi:LacI family transcriptional regulator